MSASRFAAMKERIKAKEAAANATVKANIAAQNKEWEAKEAQEREQRRLAVAEIKAKQAADESAAKRRRLDELRAPSCTCGIPAKRKEVVNAGPHCGRPFFACARELDRCDFFKWAELLLAELSQVDTAASASKDSATQKACRCGLFVVRKVVASEGPNQGRPYLSCAKGKKETGGCGFFDWLPIGDDSAVQAAALPSVCRCGLATVRKTVAKEGPNHGRAYVTCERGKKEFGGCGLFEWVPHAGDDSGAQATAQGTAPSSSVCRCGIPVIRRTVTTEGANHGRAFLRCEKGKKEFGGCGFFEWAPSTDGTTPTKGQPPTATKPPTTTGPRGGLMPLMKSGA